VLGCLRMRHILGERTNSLYLLSAGVSFPPLILPSPFPVGPAHTIPLKRVIATPAVYPRLAPGPYLTRVGATRAVYPRLAPT